jgi:phosphoadenosine phosphosulfate reductase
MTEFQAKNVILPGFCARQNGECTPLQVFNIQLERKFCSINIGFKWLRAQWIAPRPLEFVPQPGGASMPSLAPTDLDAALAAEPDLVKRLRMIAASVPGKIAFSTSLGLEDQALLHAIAAAEVPVDVFTLDTGRHFSETLDVIEASIARYGIAIRVVAPDAPAVEALVARDGINGFRLSIDNRKACCDVRKVVPLNRALKGASGWITGLRREQSSGRAHVPFAQRDAATGVLKLNPLADWTLARLEATVAEHDIPVNALHARGYPSIGCQPCTRAIRPGEDIRAGRWWWENEDGKECGLHNRPTSKASAKPAVTTPAVRKEQTL